MQSNKFNGSNMKKFVMLSIIAVMCSAVAIAQGPDDPGGNVEDVPVDGGISLLVAAGVGYGIKKVRDERKKKAQEVLSDKL